MGFEPWKNGPRELIEAVQPKGSLGTEMGKLELQVLGVLMAFQHLWRGELICHILEECQTNQKEAHEDKDEGVTIRSKD